MMSLRTMALAFLAATAACSTAAAAETCSADQIRYAREAGVPCSSLTPVAPSTAAVLARTASLYASPAGGPVGEMLPAVARRSSRDQGYLAVADVLPPQNMEGPGVAYVLPAGPTRLVDLSGPTAMLAIANGGMLGFGVAHLVGSSQGRDVVQGYGIDDPSGLMARRIAVSFAAANDGHLVQRPLLEGRDWRRSSGGNPEGGRADYVVEIQPDMALQRFWLASSRVDLAYSARAKVFDASSGQVVAKARCRVRAHNTPDDVSRSELLANDAEGLKALIASKSQICVDQLKTKLAI